MNTSTKKTYASGSNSSPDKKRRYRRKKKNRRNSPKGSQQKLRARSSSEKKPRKSSSSKPKKNLTVYEKYWNLLQLHLDARKKYFEYFYRKQGKAFIKLKNNFYKTIRDLRSFERRLNAEEVRKLENRINALSLDTDYSQKCQESLNEQPPQAPYDDPHLSLVQKERPSYAQDTQESSGSMEDYIEYKKAMGSL